jgi:hypothetical protein
MTSVASHATVKLTPDDLKMIRAFAQFDRASPTCSPKKDQIERGYGDYRFPHYDAQKRLQRFAGLRVTKDTTGPNVFKRLVALHVIEHSRNGHCWLTDEGKRIAKELAA